MTLGGDLCRLPGKPTVRDDVWVARGNETGPIRTESAPGEFVWSQRLFAEVDANVELVVIPVGLVLAAPIAVGVHTIHVTIHLAAVLAVAVGVVIDPGAIRFEPSLAIRARVRPNRNAHGEEQTSGQCGGQSHSSP